MQMHDDTHINPTNLSYRTKTGGRGRQTATLTLHPAARSAQKDSEARTCCPLLPHFHFHFPFLFALFRCGA